MRRWRLTGVDERVNTINDKLRATESQHSEAHIPSPLGARQGGRARGQCKDDREHHACDRCASRAYWSATQHKIDGDERHSRMVDGALIPFSRYLEGQDATATTTERLLRGY
jgi:hypothetical protein